METIPFMVSELVNSAGIINAFTKINMKNRLSFTRINLFQECGKKYELYYEQKLRPDTTSSALIFGRAIDLALNSLLLERDLSKAKDIFSQELKETTLNGIKINPETSDKVIYYDTDLDEELLTKDDKNKENLKYWSLYRKGIIILDSYNGYVLPKIKEVIVCQKRIEIENELGDVIEGTIDLIARLNDGKVYLLDHKTSSSEYSDDSAGKSTQLVLYHYLSRDNYDLHGVGFIVLNKHIWKKRKKICGVCGYDGSGERHKTCSKVTEGTKTRCNGEWITTIDPTCFINIILNDVNLNVENMVLDTFDGVNELIKEKKFIPNLNSCVRGKNVCPYYQLCHNKKYDKLVKIEEEKKK